MKIINRETNKFDAKYSTIVIFETTCREISFTPRVTKKDAIKSIYYSYKFRGHNYTFSEINEITETYKKYAQEKKGTI